MDANQKLNSVKGFIASLFPILFCGWLLFSTCDVSKTKVKGTYKWDYNGREQTIVISSNGETGPCIWIGESGDTSNESYMLYESIYDRPQLYIRGMVYIDIENRMVYSSDDDFMAYRNGRTCRIIR